MQTELEYAARFPESLYDPLIWDSEEASVPIFSLDGSRWDYVNVLGHSKVLCIIRTSPSASPVLQPRKWLDDWDSTRLLHLETDIYVVQHHSKADPGPARLALPPPLPPGLKNLGGGCKFWLYNTYTLILVNMPCLQYVFYSQLYYKG